MRIIINSSNLYYAGGVQVALSVLNELKLLNSKHEFYVLLSPVIWDQIAINEYPGNFYFDLLSDSPAALNTRRKVQERFAAIEDKFRPDVTLSIFTPAYLRPKSIHVGGFAMGWIINPQSIAWSRLGVLPKIKKKLENAYKKYHIVNELDHYIVETKIVKNQLCKSFKIPEDKVSVIGNTVSRIFFNSQNEQFPLPPKEPNEFRLISISRNYVHKNLVIIRQIIPLLQNGKTKFKFILTIDPESYQRQFADLSGHVINLKPVDVKYCPSLYKQSDALFLPTLLESFTASYPEAMKMGLPILTSGYPFAKEICQDAALYFDPLNPEDVAAKIKHLANQPYVRDKLVQKGYEVLKNFETARGRAIKYLELCEQLVKNRR